MGLCQEDSLALHIAAQALGFPRTHLEDAWAFSLYPGTSASNSSVALESTKLQHSGGGGRRNSSRATLGYMVSLGAALAT